MNVLEKDLEDMVYDCIRNGKKNLLMDKGLRCVGDYDVFDRQLDLGVYGRLDVVGFKYNPVHKFLNVGVFEFKKDQINVSTLLQAIRYCRGIQNYVGGNSIIWCEFKIILVGTSICLSDFCYIPDILDKVKMYTAKVDFIQGVRFNVEDSYKPKEVTPYTPPISTKIAVLNHIKQEIRSKVDFDNSLLPF